MRSPGEARPLRAAAFHLTPPYFSRLSFSEAIANALGHCVPMEDSMKATVWPLFLLLTSALHAQTEPPPRPFIPVDPSSTPRPAESISLGNLMVPPKAVKELQRSQAALQSGDLRSSAQHLEKA